MFCVIQKVKYKKKNPYGAHKRIEVTTNNWSIGNGKPAQHYSYRYSDERFDRPILDAYKISLHQSYRENGKVKKKQYSICTSSFYDIVEYGVHDAIDRAVKHLTDELVMDETELYNLIYKKVNPLLDELHAEFEATEEYKVKQEQKAFLDAHRAREYEFEQDYGEGTYKYCYDVFGELRNSEYLEQLKHEKRVQEEYRKRSEEEQQKRFEREYQQYSNGSSGSYSSNSQGNYTDDEKAILKELYRMASKKFHPDVTKDDGSKMKFITKLKEQWGL